MKARLQLATALMCFLETAAMAQLLPRGVGAYQMGYRKFDPQAQYFDNNGTAHRAGDKFRADFNSSGIAAGNSGSDFERLYHEVKKFESEGATHGVADDMDFGQVRGDIKTDIQAKFFALAYGVSDRWTVFAAVPFVSARSDAEFYYSGANNAAEIKARLGKMVYQEMQNAFDQASRLSDQSIRDNLETKKGYRSLDHWEYSGLGDIPVGARTEVKGSRWGMNRFNLGLSGQLDLATGFQDDPDILIDLPISRGYHAVTIGSDAKLAVGNMEGGVLSSLTLGIPRDTIRRVSDGNERLPGADRKTTVHLQPGPDVAGGLYGGYGNTLLKGTYQIGAKKHMQDQVSGSLEGDYASMEKNSESSKVFHRLTFTLTTVDAYARKKIAIPFILSLAAHDTFAGVNTGRERYVELSLTSFFSTPAAAKATVSNERPKSRKMASQ